MKLQELLKQKFVLFDGAIGTQLYDRGVLLHRSFEEQNLIDPERVRSVHRSYIKAGADILTSNTFAANRFRLASFGLEDQVAAINRAGLSLLRSELRCAEETAKDDPKNKSQNKHLVAASVGPCLRPEQLWQEAQRSAVEAAFAEQIEALCLPIKSEKNKDRETGENWEERPDLILGETFSHGEEIDALYRAYYRIAQKVDLPPLVLGLSVGESGLSASGFSWAQFVQRYGDCKDICALMLNCSLGPAQLFAFVEPHIQGCPKPLVVRPNAGYPQESAGRMVYVTTPEYFTLYGKRFRQIGAAAYGGCCGTGPQHIAECARLLRSLHRQNIAISPAQPFEEKARILAVPLSERSRWGAKLAKGECVSSIELLPPRTPFYSALVRKAQQCEAAGIDAINIPDGPRASARISPLLSALEIEAKAKIETILHYTCRDRNLLGIQADLLGAHASGLRNLLAVTGDPPKLGDYPNSSGVFDLDAIGLAKLLQKLKHGQDIASSPLKKSVSYVVGVALNPVSLNLAHEVERFVQKVASGADFAITQPVFEAKTLLHCLDLCSVALAGAGLAQIPIVVGIWPLASYRNAEFLANEVPGIEIPRSTMARMAACQGKEEELQMGVALAHETWQELQNYGKPIQGVQVSAPFGRLDAALQVLGNADNTSCE